MVDTSHSRQQASSGGADRSHPWPQSQTIGGFKDLQHSLFPANQESEVSPEGIQKARELLQEAADSTDMKRMHELATKAIELDPEFASAYFLAGQSSSDAFEALSYYLDGIDILATDMGPEFIREYMGSFWDFSEGRQMMVGLEGLAETYDQLGMIGLAIQKSEFMLGLDNQDRMGARYRLFHHYLKAGRLNEGRELLEEFRDDSGIVFLYGRPLLEMLENPQLTELSGSLIRSIHRAMDANPYIYRILLKEFPPSQAEPEQDPRPGSVEEALIYLEDALIIWLTSSIAMDVLSQVVADRGD